MIKRLFFIVSYFLIMSTGHAQELNVKLDVLKNSIILNDEITGFFEELEKEWPAQIYIHEHKHLETSGTTIYTLWIGRTIQNGLKIGFVSMNWNFGDILSCMEANIPSGKEIRAKRGNLCGGLEDENR